jgi:hypothetical protein
MASGHNQRFSEYALVIAGLGLIVAGLYGIYLDHTFQMALIEKTPAYRWKSDGVAFVGIWLVLIGGMMMAFAAVTSIRVQIAATPNGENPAKRTDQKAGGEEAKATDPDGTKAATDPDIAKTPI